MTQRLNCQMRFLGDRDAMGRAVTARHCVEGRAHCVEARPGGLACDATCNEAQRHCAEGVQLTVLRAELTVLKLARGCNGTVCSEPKHMDLDAERECVLLERGS